MNSIIHTFDINVLDFIARYCHNYFLDKLMIFITHLGNMGFIWIIISIILIFYRKHRKTGVVVIFALILSSILGDVVLKHLFHRARPFIDIPGIHLLIPKPLSYSFPSGHTTTSFAAAGVLIKEFKKYRFYIIFLASMIAFSRLYLYVHYPTDVITGIVLGLICSAVAYAFGKKYLANLFR